MIKKIYIIGSAGTFDAVVAQKFFGRKIEIISSKTCQKLLNITQSNIDVHAAIIPIENFVAGSILANYRLLQKSNLKVTGEVYLETGTNRYTRYLILQRKGTADQNEINKSSLYFEMDNHSGSLMRVLSIISRYNINLSKLQSVLMPDRVWVFAFYADMEFDSLDDFNNAVDHIKNVAEKIFIYGVYKKGQLPVY